MAKQQDNPFKNAPRGNKPKIGKGLYMVYGVILIALLFGFFGSDSATRKPITWERLEVILENEDYQRITVINQ